MNLSVGQVAAKDAILFASPLKGEGVHVKEGQTLIGRVLSVSDQGIVVNLSGLKILAKTNLPLVEGNEIRVRVEQIAGDRIMLKLLDQNTGLKASLQPLTDSDIEEVLMNLGIEQSTNNVNIVKSVVESGLPVSRGLIINISELLLTHGLDQNDIKSIVAIIAKGVPVTNESIKALNSLINGGLIGDDLLDLVQHLPRYLPLANDQLNNLIFLVRNIALGEFSDAESVENSLKLFVEQLTFDNRLLGTLAKDINPEELISQLKAGISGLLDEAIARLNSVPYSNFKETGIPANVANTIATILNELNSADSIKELYGLGVKALDAGAAVLTKLDPVPMNEKTSSLLLNLALYVGLTKAAVKGGALDINRLASAYLKPNLLKAIEILEQRAQANLEVKPFVQTLAKVANNILGQQITANNQGAFNHLSNPTYLQVPFLINNRFETVEIIINDKQGKDGKPDPNNTTIAIFLEMPSLGLVGVNLQFTKDDAGCHFIVSNESVRNLIESNFDEIKNIFKEKLGKVTNVWCTVFEKVKRPQVEELMFSLNPQKIDIVA